MKNREKQLEERHKPVRAPYKKKKLVDSDKLKVYSSQKKAKKDPQYDLLQNEDLEEVDDENVAEFPLKKSSSSA